MFTITDLFISLNIFLNAFIITSPLIAIKKGEPELSLGIEDKEVL
tara:strand:+ start:176 stop:310 length:135 start_codon:yes stop_codon:yes gene_type:complete